MSESEPKSIKVQLRDGAVKDCILQVALVSPWKLVFSGVYLAKREFVGEDLFEALIALRQELEGIGAQLLCAGARYDVFPSGMSRSMGGGRKAYITRLHSPSRRTDLVDIFDYAESKSAGSIAQQRAFHDEWVSSLDK